MHCSRGNITFVSLLRYNKKEKKKEQQVLEQGIRLRRPDITSKEPLLPAATRPATLPTVNFAVLFTYTFPENTAGQAKVCGNPSQPVISPSPLQRPVQSMHLPVQLAQSSLPQLPQYPVLIMPPLAALSEAGSLPMPEPQTMSRSRHYYLKRKQEKELADVTTRKYVRSSKPIVCGKCGQPRNAKNHKQYFGNWYCKTRVSLIRGVKEKSNEKRLWKEEER